MKRLNLLIDETLLERLKEVPGTLSENIRTAIVRYLHWLDEIKHSASKSRKDGD